MSNNISYKKSLSIVWSMMILLYGCLQFHIQKGNQVLPAAWQVNSKEFLLLKNGIIISKYSMFVVLLQKSLYNFMSSIAKLTKSILCSKILSLIVSFFSSTYVTKWRAILPQKDLKCAPSFRARVICCASMEVLQAYLLWRQGECKLNLLVHRC